MGAFHRCRRAHDLLIGKKAHALMKPHACWYPSSLFIYAHECSLACHDADATRVRIALVSRSTHHPSSPLCGNIPITITPLHRHSCDFATFTSAPVGKPSLRSLLRALRSCVAAAADLASMPPVQPAFSLKQRKVFCPLLPHHQLTLQSRSVILLLRSPSTPLLKRAVFCGRRTGLGNATLRIRVSHVSSTGSMPR